MQQRYAGSCICKLGEGSFKEVFLCDSDVVSVIPIEGNIVINDLKQPTAEKILPELVAHQELSQLRQPTAPHADPAGWSSIAQPSYVMYYIQYEVPANGWPVPSLMSTCHLTVIGYEGRI